MTYPITAPASGAFPINAAWGATATFANTDQNNTNSVANYAWRGVDSAPTVARCASVGSETYTIVSGSVTLITGTTLDGVTIAANDVLLLKDCPSASGVGSVGSTQPANGLYYCTGLSGGIQVARAATMSSTGAQANPGGRVVFTRFEGVVNGSTFWQCTAPASDATFTYGTTAMGWENFFLAGQGIPNSALQQAGINNFNSAIQSLTVVSGVPVYITSSNLKMPTVAITGMTANKTTFVWNIVMTKTAVGTGTFQIIFYRGANATTADTADATQTIAATQTAAIDTLTLQIQLIVVTIGATGSYHWVINADNRAGATGFNISAATSVFTGTVSSVALNTANLQFGIGFTHTTGTPVIAIPMVQAFAYNMN